jgi:CheY-like chemotaxis protein
MMALRARDRGLSLNLEVLQGVPMGLVGDPHRLRQILVNLIGNALKFTEEGGVTLRVEVDPVATIGGSAPGWLRFNVVDTGIGIAPDKTEMIFERFTQADSSTTRKYGGTGLGLAISKGLVELMGGRLGCTSELGNGSTFFLAAPFAIRKDVETGEPAEPETAVLTPAPCATQRQVFRILLAEDSQYNVLLIKAYLQNSGFELDVVENGKIAVERVVSGRFDLVLMDLQMPVMDGLEATRAIRHWEAHAVGEGVGRSLQAGCTEHLTKPIKKATLLEAIARNLGGKIRIIPPQGIEGLVPNYLACVRQDMDQILASVDSNDCQLARRLGHQFKGSGEGYGFPEITRTGAAVELAAMAADEDEIRSQILSLARYLDRVEILV